MKPVVAYVDGSSGKDGHGGAGVVLLGPKSILRVGAHIGPPCTNQQAEMFAALFALCRIEVRTPPTRIIIVSDSAYLTNCFIEGWIPNWRRRGWRTSAKKPVANREMWETLESWTELHDVEWRHTRGHSGDHYNEMADVLAHTARIERRSWTHRKRRKK